MIAGRTTSWLPRAATVLAVLSCYGTTLAVALLSPLGISVAVNERAWAGAIGVFATLATLAIAVSCRRHRSIRPTVVAVAGLALILWAMFGSYSRSIEFAGFVLLVAATLLDWRMSRQRGAAVETVAWIEPGELGDRLALNPGLAVIDVRGPDEFTGSLGHIAAARNLPVGELANRLSGIDALKKSTVVLVCRTEKRSAAAAALLRRAGFDDVRVLRGGMERWSRENRPIADRSRQSTP